MQRSGVAAVLRRSSTRTATVTGAGRGLPDVLPADALEWSWPPYAPVLADVESFDTDEWAPPSVVWHPQLRVGRWTVLYRRDAG
ncbi:hypothetical protein [Modestobacter sp. SSW1-42]|uniref:hypothetical protein n=1 Tax=Modestobacter sp. SSW1-42 TaxID=596372 RepID=UPI00398576EB